MELTTTLVVRLWNFDMDSAVLGPIRCAFLNVEKKVEEFEESMRADAIDSTTLARDVLQTVAHRRTGDATIDAKCGGPTFTVQEVARVSLDELDWFCDKLATTLVLTLPEAGAHPPPTSSDKTGRAGLVPALLRLVDAQRAEWKRVIEAAGDRVGIFPLQAQMQRDVARMADEGSTIARAMRAAHVGNSMMGREDQVVSSIDHAWKRAADQIGTATASFNAVLSNNPPETAQGQGAATSAIERMADAAATLQAVDEGCRAGQVASTLRSSRPALLEPMSARHLGVLTNPGGKATAAMEDLVALHKREAARGEAARAQAASEAEVDRRIAKSGLFYSAGSFWTAVVMGVITIAGGAWSYFVAEAAVAKEKSALKMVEELRAEIRTLRAKKHVSDLPLKLNQKNSPNEKAATKAR